MAMTIPYAIPFLAEVTLLLLLLFLFFLPHLCSQQQHDLDYTTLRVPALRDECRIVRFIVFGAKIEDI